MKLSFSPNNLLISFVISFLVISFIGSYRLKIVQYSFQYYKNSFLLYNSLLQFSLSYLPSIKGLIITLP